MKHSLYFEEKHTLQVSENQALWKIFGLKSCEVKNGRFYKMKNFLINVAYLVLSARLQQAGLVVQIGEIINAYKFSLGEPLRKQSVGRPRRKVENNIKMEIVWGDVNWLRIMLNHGFWY